MNETPLVYRARPDEDSRWVYFDPPNAYELARMALRAGWTVETLHEARPLGIGAVLAAT